MTENSKTNVKATLKEARGIADFIKTNGGPDLENVLTGGLTTEEIDALPDDAVQVEVKTISEREASDGTQFKDARLLMDFLKKHGYSEELKIVVPPENFDDDLKGVPYDALVMGMGIDGDSVEMVGVKAQVFHLKYFGTRINALMLNDDSVWFDPFDFQQFRDPKKNLLKDVEVAKQKLLALEETDGLEYVATFDDGKFIFSFDGLQTLTRNDGWSGYSEGEWFCSWLESLLGFVDVEAICDGEGLTFSIGY